MASRNRGENLAVKLIITKRMPWCLALLTYQKWYSDIIWWIHYITPFGKYCTISAEKESSRAHQLVYPHVLFKWSHFKKVRSMKHVHVQQTRHSQPTSASAWPCLTWSKASALAWGRHWCSWKLRDHKGFLVAIVIISYKNVLCTKMQVKYIPVYCIYNLYAYIILLFLL